MPNKYEVRHEDGTVSKRTTANRHYPFAVEVVPIKPEALAASHENAAVTLDQKAAKIEAALVEPKFSLTNRGFSRNSADPDAGYNGEPTYHNFTLTLIGTGSYCWANSKGETESWNGSGKEIDSFEDSKARLIEAAREQAEGYRASAADYRKRAEQVRSGKVENQRDKVELRRYDIVRWTSRRDLAEKALSGEFSVYQGRARVVETVKVG